MPYKFESTDKYLKKLDGSLSGRSFRILMDDRDEYELFFLTEDLVQWKKQGTELKTEKYGCLKADDNTYFTASILSGTKYRTCVTLVIDEEQSLVTMIVSKMGIYEKRPRLVVPEFRFGAILKNGQPLPIFRHGFTRELVGKKITWHYASGFVNTHIYTNERFCRIRPIESGDAAAAAATAQDQKDREAGLRPKEMLYDEPMRFIKIKDGMYLMSFVEENMNYVDSTRGGNNMVVLANTKGGFDCGRTFSMNREQKPEHGFFKAYGEYIVEDIPAEHEPTPYRV